MAIDRLPSGRFRARLMISGQIYTATLPTGADARLWGIATRATAALRCRAARVTFGAYAANWLAGFLEDALDWARFEAALTHRLLTVLGELSLLEVLDADRDELHRRLADAGRAGMATPRGSAWSWSSRTRSTSWMPGPSMSVHGSAAAVPAGESTGRHLDSAGG